MNLVEKTTKYHVRWRKVEGSEDMALLAEQQVINHPDMQTISRPISGNSTSCRPRKLHWKSKT